MERMRINQFEDVFHIGNKSIVVNYLRPSITELPHMCEENIETYVSEELDTLACILRRKLLDAQKKEGKQKVTFTLIPSYNCNMACEYCFEGRQVSKAPTLFYKLPLFVERIQKEYRAKECEIILLGGEPVLAENIPVFSWYISRIKEIMEVTGVSCITNGLEVMPLYPALRQMGVSQYQVTLDGLRDTHNKRRPAKNVSIDSFATVVDTINFLVKNGESVEVRINIDQQNVKELPQFIELCFANGWHNFLSKNMQIYAYPVSENGVCADVCYSSEAVLLQEILRELSSLPFYKRIISLRVHGLNFIDSLYLGKIPDPIIKFCSANHNQFVFAPNGTVHSCWWGHHDDENVIGQYDSKLEVRSERINYWRSRSISNMKNCNKCKYQFVCGGGCTYKALSNHGSVLSGNCAEFKKIFQTYLEYRYGTL